MISSYLARPTLQWRFKPGGDGTAGSVDYMGKVHCNKRLPGPTSGKESSIASGSWFINTTSTSHDHRFRVHQATDQPCCNSQCPGKSVQTRPRRGSTPKYQELVEECRGQELCKPVEVGCRQLADRLSGHRGKEEDLLLNWWLWIQRLDPEGNLWANAAGDASECLIIPGWVAWGEKGVWCRKSRNTRLHL